MRRIENFAAEIAIRSLPIHLREPNEYGKEDYKALYDAIVDGETLEYCLGSYNPSYDFIDEILTGYSVAYDTLVELSKNYESASNALEAVMALRGKQNDN